MTNKEAAETLQAMLDAMDPRFSHGIENSGRSKR